jgi:hypothetical protein
MRLSLPFRQTLVGLALLLVATPAFAQIITGRLFEEGSVRPIAGATVQLLSAQGTPLDRVVQTNETGSFAIRVEPGRYTLRIRRIGIREVVTRVIQVKANEIFEGNFRVSPIAVRLATQRITEKPSIEWGRDGFMRRKDLSEGGLFLTRNDFGDKDQSYFAYLLRDVPGLLVTPDGTIKSLEGWRCLKYMVNGIPVESKPGSFPGDNTFPTLQDMVPTGHDVMGIEVYREFKEVPKEYRLTAWVSSGQGARSTGVVGVTPGATHSTAGRVETPCGIITVWTKAAW